MNNSEEHFDDSVWLDFVRGLAAVDLVTQVQHHLDTRCEVCMKTHAIWNEVLEFTRHESEYVPPEDVVNSVKAAFLKQGLHIRPKVAQVARLIFDSLREPLAAGVRGVSAPARHLSYRSGGLLVDLRLEWEDMKRVSMAGQAVHVDRGAESTARSSVALLQGEDRPVAQRTLNSFGEFQMEFDYQEDLRLYFDVPGVGPALVILPSLKETFAP